MRTGRHAIGERQTQQQTVGEGEDRNDALDYAKFKNIPLARRFSTRRRETESRGFDLRYFKFTKEFTFLSETSLSPLTSQDKLYIFAHANPKEVGFTVPRMLAGMLHANGLQAVGLITFKACEVGVGNFLETFVNSAVKKGIVLGWAKGYKGSAATVVHTTGHTVTGLSEKIYGDGDNVLTGNARVKIVRSPNCPFAVSFGRYA